MSNISNNYIRINPGEPIAKIEFSRLASAVSRPYSGQHGYQTEIWPIRMDMVLDREEVDRDGRIKDVVDELERAYGQDFASVVRRVFVLERKLIISASIYFTFMLVLVGIMSKTDWLTTTQSVILGVGSNVISQLLFYFSTRVKRSR